MECVICLGLETNLLLECGHKIHLDCLKDSFENGYREQRLKDFNCPNCNKELSDGFIFEKMGLEYYEKKSDILFYQSCYQEKQNSNKSIICINNNCLSLYFFDASNPPDQFYICPNCSTSFCTKCSSDVHKQIPDCLLNQQEIIKAANKRFCPNCKIFYTKSCGTCNKIKCKRDICGTIFCNLCSKVFKTEQYCYDHYGKTDNPCNGKLWLETDY